MILQRQLAADQSFCMKRGRHKRRGGGVKAISDWLEGGGYTSYEEVWGEVSTLRYILKSGTLPQVGVMQINHLIVVCGIILTVNRQIRGDMR